MKQKIALSITSFILFSIPLLFIIKSRYQNTTPSLIVINNKDVAFSPSVNLKYFYEPKPNTKQGSNMPGMVSTQTINSDSLNERFEYTTAKPENTFRIITLGDSFTFGQYVDTKDNWPEKLEDMLNLNLKCKNIKKFEVINLGVYGYDAQYEVERFKKRGEKYNPDLVIWYFIDLLRYNEKIRGDYLKAFSAFQKDNPNASQGTLDQNRGKLAKESVTKSVNELGKSTILNFQKTQIKLFRQYYKGKVLIASYPGLNSDMTNFLINAANENNFIYEENMRDYHNMSGDFSSANIHPNFHPNQKGHQIIAEDYFNFLTKNKMIACNAL